MLNKLFLLIFILSLTQHCLAQDNGFYINGDVGLLPYSWIVVASEQIDNTAKESGTLIMGIEPSYKINSQNHVSAFVIFEGHNSPLSTTFALGAKWRYFFKPDNKSPFAGIAIGNGIQNIPESGSNGIYGATEIGYQCINKRGKPYRFALGYSLQESNDYDYSEVGFGGVITDAVTHSIKLTANLTLFRSKRLRDSMNSR